MIASAWGPRRAAPALLAANLVAWWILHDAGYRSALMTAPEASRLRISVNGRPLADYPIKAPERLAELSAVLPAGLLRPGPNVFTIETEQRHRTDCTEASTYDLWTEIDAGRTFLSFPAAGAGRLTALGDIRAR